MFRTRCVLTLATIFLVVAAAAAMVLAQQPLPAEGDEAQLIAVLQQADAPLFDKAKACQTLAVIGTKQCVPVLAGLLGDEKLAHYARFGLEPIPDPSVDEALHAAMGKLQGMLLVGVIDSIGVRRDAAAVDDLKNLLGNSDQQVAAAAAAALGRIATVECAEALEQALGGPANLRPAVGDACLTACDVLLAAGKSDEAAALCDAVFQADVPRHLQIAAAHGAIRAQGAAGLPRLVEYLRSEDEALFKVALGAAQELGGPDVARTLMAEVKLPEVAEAPQKGLVILKAEYGAGDRWVDVTEQVAAAARSGTPIEASNSLAGDPAKGVVKQLRIVYSKDGKEQTVEIPEKERITLEGGAAARHPRQTLLIYTLGNLGEKTALPVILEAAQSQAWDIRRAGIRVLGELGDASAVPVLLSAAVEGGGGLSNTARESLARLEGEDVDAAIVAALQATEGPKRAVLIRLVGDRGISSAVPALLKDAGSDDQQIRQAAIQALGVTVGLDQLDALIVPLLEPKSPEEMALVLAALKTACLRMPDRDATAAKLFARMPQASVEAKDALLDLLGTVGGAKALEGVAAAARDPNEEVQDAATRVLGGWMSPAAAPVLLELAKTGNEKFRIRVLRGYIRIARQLDVAPDERLAMCQAAMATAGRDQEKKLVLEVLGRNPSARALALVIPHISIAGLKDDAGTAAVTIAEKIVDAEPAAVVEAMQQVIAVTGNNELAARARALLARAKRKLGGT